MLLSCSCQRMGGLGGADEAIRTYHARGRRLACDIYRGQGAGDKMPTHHCSKASPLLQPPEVGSSPADATAAAFADGRAGRRTANQRLWWEVTAQSAKCRFAIEDCKCLAAGSRQVGVRGAEVRVQEQAVARHATSAGPAAVSPTACSPPWTRPAKSRSNVWSCILGQGRQEDIVL